ncbi:MAG TPA: lysine--tRNA ligase, partial [Pyrinomonadaceae bacterium]|nr:lysine--tRNA ligase [Pyrinomonadaceae bacterium]
MNIPEFDDIIEPNDQTAARAEHLEKLRELVGNVYPNKFDRTNITGGEDTITNILRFEPVAAVVNEIKAVIASLEPGTRPAAEIKEALNARLKDFGSVRIAGRLTTPPRGNFVHLTDGMSKLQIYCKKGTFALVRNDAENSLDQENGWTAYGMLDHGDFIGVEGYLFITNTGELSVHVEKLQFLAKAMLPMPDKMHGILDAEIKQRQRYVDLIGSSLRVDSHEPGAESETELTTRQVFERRAKVISSLRHFLEDHGYIEVETPMLTPKATGAAAKPFKTHHNALDIDLYARIAPELYLKRLVVGGFEKVYELNRNFRNEGISYKHNPEFTMLEFYCAYMDVEGMMDFCENLVRESVQKTVGGLTVNYESNEIIFVKFERISMKEAVRRRLVSTKLVIAEMLPAEYFDSVRNLLIIREFLDRARNLEINQSVPNTTMSEQEFVDKIQEEWISSNQHAERNTFVDQLNATLLLVDIFEEFAEPNLIQPTFIIDYPKSVSPLSKANPTNPEIAERFELFINGMEVANGFSELNDPKEQYERFVDQMSERERGDEEAMMLDEDYIRALSYGMPPAAGIGIGIDRLVMMLTGAPTIRDVVLFPLLKRNVVNL